jgi:TonB family protein
MLELKNEPQLLIRTLMGSIAVHGLLIILINSIDFSFFSEPIKVANRFVEVSLEPGSTGKEKKSLHNKVDTPLEGKKFIPAAFKPVSKTRVGLVGVNQLSQKNKEIEIDVSKVTAGANTNKFSMTAGSLINQNANHVFSEPLSIPGHSHSAGLHAIDVDPIVSYTFMHRFGRSVYPRWINRLRIALNGVAQEELLFYPYKQTLTIFEIQMNKEGNLTKLILLQSSGIDSIDRSAGQALYEAKKFPNPPQFLKVHDNLYRLKVAFNVILAN